MKTLLFYSLVVMGVLISACHKGEHACYSRQLEKEYKDKFCTADCPGVVGCDGKSYCNECEANRKGIKLK